MMLVFVILYMVALVYGFQTPVLHHRIMKSSIVMADVEVIFPNNKKIKVPSGSSLKEAAKKAGFTPNYGCEEGSI